MSLSSEIARHGTAPTAVALALSFSACHQAVRIQDATVEFAVYDIASRCAAVRKEALNSSGSADAEVLKEIGSDRVRESCACSNDRCEYEKGRSVETMCSYGTCTQYDVTTGTLFLFDGGDDGIMSQVSIERTPLPDLTGATKNMKTEVISLNRPVGVFESRVCEFATVHFDGSIMKEPRIIYTGEMNDCLAAQRLVTDVLGTVVKTK